MFKLIVIIIYSYLIFARPIFAQSKILINEFLIDPQPQSVEIFNSGTESVDISDWIIDDSGGTTFYTIPKDSILFPNQCLVFSSDFNLNKTSADTVKLINNSQLLIDSFSYKSSSGSGISYFRLPDSSNNWTTGSANLGFYNSNREQKCLFPTLTPTPILTPTTIPTSTITPTLGSEDPTPSIGTENPSPTTTAPVSYDNIYLSEAMVNPVTGEKEWLEIYNDNDFPISLKNWYVDDLENTGSSPKIFSLEISAKSYGVFNLFSSMFNNDGDSVRLLDFNKNLKDDFEYEKSEQGKTLGRTRLDLDDFCLQEPSKNFVNNPCINPILTTTSICTGQACLTPTINVIASKTQIYWDRTNPTPTLPRRSPAIGGTETGLTSPDILGLSTKKNNNHPLINLLCFLSISYSLLTIISILFKMKLSYGKNKNFYSPPLHSS
ncbi:MAG TPA: lamin tail domain-containing protein [Patescibacteria group bacterium]